MSRICKSVIGVGPRIGQTQLVADSRLCLPKMNVQQNIGEESVGFIINYPGGTGAISYPGGTGLIIYP